MSSLDLATNLFDVARMATGLAVNWLIQSTLLIIGGLVVAYLLRKHGSAVQSAVYRTTLVATLVCPLATWGLSLLGVSGWSLVMPSAYSVESPVPNTEATAQVATTRPPLADSGLNSGPTIDQAKRDSQEPLASRFLSRRAVAESPIGRDEGPQPTAIETPIPAFAANEPINDPHFNVHRFGTIAATIGALWLIIGAGLLGCLALAWWQLHRLRRGARLADSLTIESCREIAARLQVAPPEVLHTPFLPSPCLAGLRRPVVMLPETELSLPVRDVLVHELAHLRRNDCTWNLLRRTATAILFFQPLLWKLSRRLAATAEEVCDDYVVQFGGDRREYAHRLVDIATLSVAPMAASVGMVSLRSMLSGRVMRILDTSRSLSTRVGSLLLTMVLLTGLTATLLVGLVGIEPDRVAADASRGNADHNPNGTEKLATADDADDAMTVRGIVRRPNGEPLSGADVYALRWFWEIGEPKPLATTRSDANGRFSITYHKSQYFETGGRPEQWREAVIAAFASGFGPAWLKYQDLTSGADANLRLAVDDVPIEGRILDLEGKPLAGVRVAVEWIEGKSDENLDKWVAGVRSGQSWPTTSALLGTSMLPVFAMDRWSDIGTDSDGRFRISGLGRERLVRLRISGNVVATRPLAAVTRRMDPLTQPSYGKHTPPLTNFGAQFEYTAAPSRPLEGFIRDEATGAPLSGVEVRNNPYSLEGLGGVNTIKTRTDERGFYRLDGMLTGPGNEIHVLPKDQPYFSQRLKVADPPGTDALKQDIKLRRGIWVTGRVVDKVTGKPVAAHVSYVPFMSNASAADSQYAWLHRAEDGATSSRKDGTYRLVVAPGHGIVRVDTILEAYPSGQGFEAVAEIERKERSPQFAGPLTPSRRSPTAFKEIAATAPDGDVVCDFALDPGKALQIACVDPDGVALAGVEVAGWRGRYGDMKRMDAPKFDLLAFGTDESRIVQLHHEARNLGKALLVSAKDGRDGVEQIRLEPCAAISGRLVDADGRPLRGESLLIRIIRDGETESIMGRLETDPDGRFSYSKILPGLPIGIEMKRPEGNNLMVVKSLEAQHGEAIDLGTIDITTDKRPEVVRTAAGELNPASGKSARHVAGQVLGRQTAKLVAANPNPPSATEKIETTEAKGSNQAAHSSVEYAGQVVTPQGKPAVGAKIYLIYWIPELAGAESSMRKPLAVTDEAGHFHFAINPDKLPGNKNEWSYASIAAVDDGYGFAWSRAALFETSGKSLAEFIERLNRAPGELKAPLQKLLGQTGQPLRLVADDVPIRGRVMDINGQPVTGAKLSLIEMWAGEVDDLTPWLEATKENRADFYSARIKTPRGLNGPMVPALVTPAVTDHDGRFTVRGIGRERIAEFMIQGPNIQTEKIYTRTRTGETIELPAEWRSPGIGKYIYYPTEFTYLAGPSKPIVGIVRDHKSGRPLANVEIRSQKRHGHGITGWGEDFVRTVTDQNGRYQLDGMPIGDDNEIAAVAPADQPYLAIRKRAGTAAASEQPEINFDLPGGVWIEGRVTDKASGKGLIGTVEHYIFPDNPHLKGLGRLSSVDLRDRYRSDDNGHFRIPTLPGHGIVGVLVEDSNRLYPRGAGADKIAGAKSDIGTSYFRTEPSYCQPINLHALAEINPGDDTERVEINFALDSGGKVTGRVVGPDGNPLSDYIYSGRIAEFSTWEQAAAEKFEIVGFDPSRPRRLVFFHKERHLAGSLSLRGAPPDDLVVKLEPAGKVTGRLVENDGNALANIMLVEWEPKDNKELPVALPPNILHRSTGQYVTDKNGRFEIDGLVPGVQYNFKAVDRDAMSPTVGRMPRSLGPIDKVVIVEPGQTLDLGDVKLADERERSAKKDNASNTSKAKPIAQAEKVAESASNVVKQATDTAATKTNAEHAANTDSDQSIQHVQGIVLGPDGKPFGGATVFVDWIFVGQLRPHSEESQKTEHVVVAKTTSNPAGEFKLDFAKESPRERTVKQGWQVAAFSPGFGPAWIRDVNVVKEPTVTLRLTRDQAIRGRIVDFEGKPLTGVHVSVHELRPAKSEQAILDWIAAAKKKPLTAKMSDDLMYAGGSAQRPMAFPYLWDAGGLSEDSPALPADTQTDQNGRFQLDNVGENRFLLLQVEGPAIAKTYLQIVTRDMQPLAAMPANFIGRRNTLYFGRTFEYVADPTQPIEGTVTDTDTGKPLANFAVHVQQFAGNLFTQGDFLEVRTDNDGRYKLVGAPQGGGHRIQVEPPTDQPYLQTYKKLQSAPGSFDPIPCDFKLKRGRWIVGRLVEHGSGKPIVDTSIEYLPLRTNPHAKDYPNYDPEITGSSPADRYRTDKDGRFRVLAIPGAGVLGGIAQNDDRYVYTTMSVDQVPKYLVGERNQLNTYLPWIVSGYHALREIDLSESNDDVKYDLEFVRGLTRRVTFVGSSGQPVVGAQVLGRVFPSTHFEQPLKESSVELIGLRSQDRRIMVVDHPEKRIGRAMLISAGEEMKVELQPCAVVRGRFMDEDGEPVGNAAINVSIDRSDNWFCGLNGSTTRPDGRFEVFLPPGMICRVFHYEANNGPNFSAECQATPGAVFELGELKHGVKLKPEQTTKLLVSSSSAVRNPKNASLTTVGASNHDKRMARLFSVNTRQTTGLGDSVFDKD